ncbi:hypothetical protein CXG81DRAFT_16877 [Caulochytrium protostelioides]|uniref:FAM86 N-terminal domain-containing protein n=1 Tax=Caulochytrium protostelioides TaxID=1555241 RepID=A0A4P9XDP9_9FUNG|nr:hypothetical protein CXG81DRAFT_16877 [Caulochytrium protostelioides]|eukprot:RKP03646.1 hypothetical protein CXG81DRAFT_16877 [Caulochytrium protostelioides]
MEPSWLPTARSALEAQFRQCVPLRRIAWPTTPWPPVIRQNPPRGDAATTSADASDDAGSNHGQLDIPCWPAVLSELIARLDQSTTANREYLMKLIKRVQADSSRHHASPTAGRQPSSGEDPVTRDGPDASMICTPDECEALQSLDELYCELLMANTAEAQSMPASAHVVKQYPVPMPCSGLPSSPSGHPDYTYVTIREAIYTISDGTTGYVTWPACLTLCEYLAASQEAAGQRLLEIGTGVGLLAAMCCALSDRGSLVPALLHVTATDLPQVLDTLTRANLLPFSQARCHPLDWEAPHTGLADLETDYDVIVAADVVYDPVLWAPLARTLHAAIVAPFRHPVTQPRTRYALLALTPRRAQTIDGFLAALAAVGLQYALLGFDRDAVVWPQIPPSPLPHASRDIRRPVVASGLYHEPEQPPALIYKVTAPSNVITNV